MKPMGGLTQDLKLPTKHLNDEGKEVIVLTKIQKEIVKININYPEVKGLREYFLQAMKIPEEDGYADLSNLKAWVKIYEKAHKKEEGVRWLIDIAASDPFWSQNITNGTTLWAKRMTLITRKRGNTTPILTKEQLLKL